MRSRPAKLIRLLAPVLALLLLACQSEEEKVASFLENGAAYVEAGSLNEAVIEYRNVLQIDPNNAEAHYALAKAYLELKRGKDAYWELSETVRLAPKNIDARLTLGGLSLMAQNFDEALEQAQRTIELDPSKSSAYVLYGQALEALDRAEEAEAQYLKAVETDPDEGPYRLVLAGYHVRQGDRESAEPMLREFTKIDPGFLSYSSLGRFLAGDRSRVPEATAAFEKAIELSADENRAAALQNLAKYYLALERAPEAVTLLESGIEQAPDGSDWKLDLIYMLAGIKRAQGEVAEADQLIESAAAAQPDDPRPYLILSAYRGRKGDLEGALEAADAALAIEPDSAKAKLRRAELLVDMGYRAGDEARVAKGRAIVEQVLEKEPTSPDGLFVQGKVEMALGNPAAAVKALRAALDSRPDWAQAHFVLGSALTLIGEQASARVEIARAVELEPQMLEARRMLAKLHARLGEHEYAVEQGRAYLAGKPADVKTRILVAQSLLRIGRAEEALAELDQIPEPAWDAEVLFARALLLIRMNDLDSSRRLLVRAAEASPHHPEILGSLLALDRGSPRIAESRALIEAALAARPDDSEIARLNGILALVTGDANEAERSLRRAIELDPDNMSAYQQLASVYGAAGRLGETVETYELALAQQPENAQLHHFVATLYEMAGRLDDAIAGYERAIELDDDLPQAKNNLAYLLAESGQDLDRALDLAQAAKGAMPESGNAADTLGWVLYKRGLYSAAVGYLKEAVATIDPTSPSVGIVRHHLALAYEANEQRQEAIETLEIALADLEQRRLAVREKGGKPSEPEWSGEARDMLKRLKPAG
jgi:tetratricopeptide (TPR) repeat protein